MSESAIVIGAGGDIGAACALAVAQRGQVVVCVDRDEVGMARTASALEQAGALPISVVMDATAPDFAAVVSAAAPDTVRSLVYAIAFEEHMPAADISLPSVRRSFDTGPLAAFGVAQRLFATEQFQSGSSMTMIGSLHAEHAFRGTLGYNLAQAATAALVKSLAHEWAARGVRVNEVVPGWTRTAGEVQLYGEAELLCRQSALPMGRPGSIADIAQAVAFISSDAASYISGARLTVDGALGASLAVLPKGDA